MSDSFIKSNENFEKQIVNNNSINKQKRQIQQSKKLQDSIEQGHSHVRHSTRISRNSQINQNQQMNSFSNNNSNSPNKFNVNQIYNRSVSNGSNKSKGKIVNDDQQQYLDYINEINSLKNQHQNQINNNNHIGISNFNNYSHSSVICINKQNLLNMEENSNQVRRSTRIKQNSKGSLSNLDCNNNNNNNSINNFQIQQSENNSSQKKSKQYTNEMYNNNYLKVESIKNKSNSNIITLSRSSFDNLSDAKTPKIKKISQQQKQPSKKGNQNIQQQQQQYPQQNPIIIDIDMSQLQNFTKKSQSQNKKYENKQSQKNQKQIAQQEQQQEKNSLQKNNKQRIQRSSQQGGILESENVYQRVYYKRENRNYYESSIESYLLDEEQEESDSEREILDKHLKQQQQQQQQQENQEQKSKKQNNNNSVKGSKKTPKKKGNNNQNQKNSDQQQNDEKNNQIEEEEKEQNSLKSQENKINNENKNLEKDNNQSPPHPDYNKKYYQEIQEIANKYQDFKINADEIPILNYKKFQEQSKQNFSKLQEKVSNLQKEQKPIFKIENFQEIQILDPKNLEEKKQEKLLQTIQKRQKNFFEPQNLPKKNSQQKIVNIFDINKIEKNFLEKEKQKIQNDNNNIINNNNFQETFQLKDYDYKKDEEKIKKQQDLQMKEETMIIVNNNNERQELKISVNPQDNAIGGNNGRKKDEDKSQNRLDTVVNRFDVEFRDYCFNQLSFQKDYHIKYEAINIQLQQEQQLQQNFVVDNEKNHFIRKKVQNANANLKRSCGVSYVKPTESEQKNVSHLYEKLPPLIFQCSSGCQRKIEYKEFYNKTFQNIFKSPNSQMFCTYFQTEDELLMRQYLLNSEKRYEIAQGRFFLIKNINQIWPFFIDKMFLCIHLVFDQENLLQNPKVSNFNKEEIKEILSKSDIQIGLLFKKSLSGRKAFLNSLGEFIAEKTQRLPKELREQQRREEKERKIQEKLEKQERIKIKKEEKEKERQIREEQKLLIKQEKEEEIQIKKQLKQQEREEQKIERKLIKSEQKKEKKEQLKQKKQTRQQFKQLGNFHQRIQNYYDEINFGEYQQQPIEDIITYVRKSVMADEFLCSLSNCSDIMEDVKSHVEDYLKMSKSLYEKSRTKYQQKKNQSNNNNIDSQDLQNNIEQISKIDQDEDKKKSKKQNKSLQKVKQLVQQTSLEQNMLQSQEENTNNNNINNNQNNNNIEKQKIEEEEVQQIQKTPEEIEQELQEKLKKEEEKKIQQEKHANMCREYVQQCLIELDQNIRKNNNLEVYFNVFDEEDPEKQKNYKSQSDMLVIEGCTSSSQSLKSQSSIENEKINNKNNSRFQGTLMKKQKIENLQINLQENNIEQNNNNNLDNNNIIVNEEEEVKEKNQNELQKYYPIQQCFDINQNNNLNLQNIQKQQEQEQQIQLQNQQQQIQQQQIQQQQIIQNEQNQNQQQQLNPMSDKLKKFVLNEINPDLVIEGKRSRRKVSTIVDMELMDKQFLLEDEEIEKEIQEEKEKKKLRKMSQIKKRENNNFNNCQDNFEINQEKKNNNTNLNSQKKNKKNSKNNDLSSDEDYKVEEDLENNKKKLDQSSEYSFNSDDDDFENGKNNKKKSAQKKSNHTSYGTSYKNSTNGINYNKLKKLVCDEVMEYIEREGDSKTINTLSCKLELYVQKENWQSYSSQVQDLLFSFILQAQDILTNYSLKMMNTRFKMINNKDIDKLERTLEDVREFIVPDFSIEQEQQQQIQIQEEEEQQNQQNIQLNYQFQEEDEKIQLKNMEELEQYQKVYEEKLAKKIEKQKNKIEQENLKKEEESTLIKQEDQADNQENQSSSESDSDDEFLNNLKEEEEEENQNQLQNDMEIENEKKNMFEIIKKNTKKLNFQCYLKNQSDLLKNTALQGYSMPLYYISTRDSFAYDLIEKSSIIEMNGRKFEKIEYFFDPKNAPSNFYGHFEKVFPDFRVGCHIIRNFFSNEELKDIEDECWETEQKGLNRHYLPMTAQVSCTQEKLKRTKFFFGYRYIWTRQQLNEPHAYVGGGVRCDVSDIPLWMKRKVVNRLENCNIVEKNFINSFALNVYHDGKEGLAQHFDDATRFRQPIYTVRLFSDCRLSFGSQFYGFCNGAFCVPLPRGAICVMEENSYAANGIKHCVRPCDMTGKSAAMILRQMHHKVVNESIIYDQQIDLPAWMSTLSIKNDSISYGEQRKMEAEYRMNNGIGCPVMKGGY